jgi:hypothetical protein
MRNETRLKPVALDWLAQRNRDRWIKPNGELHQSRILKDAEISRSQFNRVERGECLPGQKFIEGFLDLAETTGASREHARVEMFERVQAERSRA